MRHAPHLLDEILRRTDIVQLVGRRVKLVRKGQAYWGCCPFHGEKSASFKVENARRTYKCFGCGKGGDAFRWLMEIEGISFPEAVERLAGEAGVELPKWSPEDEAREEKKKSLHDVIEAGAVFFETQLQEPVGREAREYLKTRGLDAATVKKFRLGYAPTAGNALIAHLTSLNISMDDIIAAGLARPADEGRGPRDFFFNRLMFPIGDGRGRIVAFGGRGLSPDAKPKYINTAETEFFSKGHQLYNLATARPAGIKAQSIIVAEGYMDVIALVRAGFEAAVAPLGTALTEDQLQLLWRVAPEPILSFDGDAAGNKAAIRAAHLALPHLKPGYSLRFAFLPTGEDPDSLIRTGGQGAMKAVLDAALPLGEVLWKSETEDKDFSTPERRAGLEHLLAEHVARITDAKIADYYRRDFDNRIFEAFKKRPAAGPKTPRAPWQPGAKKGRGGFNKTPPIEPVSEALKATLLVKAARKAPLKTSSADGSASPEANQGALQVKETEVFRHLIAFPGLIERHTELLASLALSDPFLDRLRGELLNVAASGSRLESQGLETHIILRGMADTLQRLKAHAAGSEMGESGEDADARFLRAAHDLRALAETNPERKRASERFKQEPNEESCLEHLRLLRDRSAE
ncbi:MAG: DNA primase [Rhizomicrobium sp.]|nr:DNA primase [Rhizomicrobium sp.]